jgi:hypothetical protein
LGVFGRRDGFLRVQTVLKVQQRPHLMRILAILLERSWTKGEALTIQTSLESFSLGTVEIFYYIYDFSGGMGSCRSYNTSIVS